MKKILLIILLCIMSLGIVSCGGSNGDNGDKDTNNNEKPNTDNNSGGSIVEKDVLILITLEDGRTIKLELYPEVAPKTVENFLALVDAKYYDGVIFHRVIKNFMIQTGGYYIEDRTIYQKQPVNQIDGEFSSNGHVNNILHEPGVISMARTNDPNSATSQFFICSAKSEHLDGKYAAFGRTVDAESLAVVIAISEVETGILDYSFQNFPLEPITIKSIRRVTNE